MLNSIKTDYITYTYTSPLPRRLKRLATTTAIDAPCNVVDNYFPYFYKSFYRYRDRNDESDSEYYPSSTPLPKEDSISDTASISSVVSSTDLFGLEVKSLSPTTPIVSPLLNKKRRRTLGSLK